MNTKVLLAALAYVFSFSIVMAQPLDHAPTEDQCKKDVEASVAALDMMRDQTGEEANLKGLSKKEILEIQATEGNCAAKRAIAQHTHVPGK